MTIGKPFQEEDSGENDFAEKYIDKISIKYLKQFVRSMVRWIAASLLRAVRGLRGWKINSKSCTSSLLRGDVDKPVMVLDNSVDGR